MEKFLSLMYQQTFCLFILTFSELLFLRNVLAICFSSLYFRKILPLCFGFKFFLSFVFSIVTPDGGKYVLFPYESCLKSFSLKFIPY